jgi:hypothetical protein
LVQLQQQRQQQLLYWQLQQRGGGVYRSGPNAIPSEGTFIYTPGPSMKARPRPYWSTPTGMRDARKK